METKTTFCRICEAGCGLLAEVEDNRVHGLSPDPDHVMTRGYACVKGIRYLDVHNSPDRLRHPLKRTDKGFVEVSWETALREIGDKARKLREQHGPHSVGMYVGNPAAFSAAHPIFAHAFASALGTHNFFGAGSQDCNNKFVAAQQMFGSPTIQPVPDFDNTNCFIIIGSNPAISQMSFINAPRPVERLKAIEKRGGYVAFVDPRRHETARQVGQHVAIRPDTDVFMLLSFAHELIASGGEDPNVARLLQGRSALRQAVRGWSPERTAKVTGIPATRLRQMVKHYREADGAALYCSTGLNQGRHGTLAVWLLNAINAISGNLDRRGGVLVPRGLFNTGLVSKLTGVGQHERSSRVGSLPAVLDAFPAAVLPDEILTPGPGQIRGMFVSAGNPVLSCPNSERMREAMQTLELLVSIDMFRNETGSLAHYILPATSFLERDDLPLGSQGFQPSPYVQYGQAVVDVDGDQRDEWWIFSRLAQACGVRMLGSRLLQAYLNTSTREKPPEALRKLLFTPDKLYQAMLLSSRQITLGDLKRYPHGVRLRPNRDNDFLGKWGRVLRKNRRVHVAPNDFVRESLKLEAVYEQELRERKQLKLISKRERTSHNSWMHNVDALVRPPRDTNYLYMHPVDATAARLDEGMLAEVSSEHGSLQVPVKLSEDLCEGVVALPHGWGHADAEGLRVARRTRGVNANELAADGPQSVEPLSGMAHLTGLRVRVRAVSNSTDEAVL